MDVSPESLFATYAPSGLDEAVEGGRLRPAWKRVADHLARLGPEGLAARREQALRLVRDNGVTYTAHSERGEERPWSLDVVPQIIAPEDWHSLARGVAQRARLLDTILNDCYGPQRLLREGLLPPAAVLSHPQFLRPLHGVAVAKRLVFYACDVVRGPNGGWRVVAEHAQVPAGAGYALENRIVLARTMAEAFRECQVERVASFFLSLRKTLRGLSPHHHDDPRIVLLTPGPYAETYFEHAYLSRYLGYTLVEGGDLTVRDNRVWLKNLGGLHRVDVILRRLADDYCDPLELRSGSVLGVPGLAGAIRAGTVAVANALGTGLGENASFLAYGDRLARHLLGEELRIPAVSTMWNDAEGLIANLDHLAIRSTYGGRAPSVLAETLDDAQRTALIERIRLSPQAFVGQERVVASTTPAWNGTAFEPRPLSLRVFAVADADAVDGYAIMPGGLARIGEASKDAWVLASAPVTAVSLLVPSNTEVALKRGGADLPSRVADNLFWLGRYAERVEGTARLIREGLRAVADGGDGDGVLTLLDQQGFRPPAPCRNGESLIRWLTTLMDDDTLPGGLSQHIGLVHRSAFAVRDRLSNDTWRIINRLQRPAAGVDGIARLDHLLSELAALAGMGMENTTRGPGWRFLDLGRRIERAQIGISLLRALSGAHGVSDGPLLDTLLGVADSTITYRSRYLTMVQAAPVLDLLLIDGTNPRSVAFQLARVVEHLAHIPGAEDLALPTEAQRIARRLSVDVELADPVALCRGPRRAELGVVLAQLDDDSGRLSDAITSLYLSHAVPTPTFR